MERFPEGEVLARAVPCRMARDSARTVSALAALPVTVPILLTSLALGFLAARAALRFQRLQPALRLILGERARAAPRGRRGRGAARSGAGLRILIPPRRGRTGAARGWRLPILRIGLPHLPQRLLQILLGVHVAR